MKIYNNGPEFELKFDGQDIVVKEGLSGELIDRVAYHINSTGLKWGNDVQLISDAEEEATVLEKNETPKEEAPIEEPVEKAPVEELKEEVIEEKVKTKKSSK